MGLLSFLSQLTNGDQGDEGDGAPQRKWGYDADGYLVPGMHPAMGGTVPIMSQPQAPAPAGNDITIQGDTWKPKKNTILGALADAISYYSDGTTPFKDERDKKNMESASKGLMTRPEEAIARIAQINPEAAWKYRGQAVDDKRMQSNLDRQNSLMDFQKQKYVYGQLANMMGVATKRNDPATWSAMRQQALNYANQYGIDASGIIPETYDKDAIDTIALGSVPVKNQMQMDETQQYHRETTDYRNRNLDERTRFHEGELNLGHERNATAAGNLGERTQHDTVTEGQGQERIDKTPAKPLRTRYETKYGRGLVSPDGMEMHITPSDPRIDQSVLHDVNGEHKLIYDNLGTADKPIWRLRK